MKRDSIGPHEAMEQTGDGTFSEPLGERIEQELRAAITVFLPTIELSSSA